MNQEKNAALPLVRMALICEHIIEDKRDSTLSVIKVIDRVRVQEQTADPSAELPPGMIAINVVIATVGGDARGERTLTLEMHDPKGLARTVEGAELVVFYDSDTAGRNWVVRMAWPLREVGTYWLVPLCDGAELTRVPLQIQYERKLTADASAE